MNKDRYTTLPPRHARGCPRNIMRSVLWQLTIRQTDSELIERLMFYLDKNLPCHCPKAGEE